MTISHSALKETARQILADKGYLPEQIHEEYEVKVGGYDCKKLMRVDVVGINQEKRIAIECGSTPGEKIAALKMFFDEVIVLPYFTINIDKAEYERTIRKQSEEISALTKENSELKAHYEIRLTERNSVITIFEDWMELFARITQETHFFSHLYDQSDLAVVARMRAKLDLLQVAIEKKMQERQNAKMDQA